MPVDDDDRVTVLKLNEGTLLVVTGLTNLLLGLVEYGTSEEEVVDVGCE